MKSYNKIIFISGYLGLCLSCSVPDYQNTELSFEERARDLVSRMTLEEKVSQMESNAPAVERLGICEFCWDNEGKHAFVSAFPASIGIAATWDTTYAFAVASAIADEARATNNINVREKKRQRYLSFWAPTINIARDPRWGRTNESFGEDPYLTARMGVSFVQGMQGNHPEYLKAVAGVNHYALYNEERDRHSVDVTLHDERLLREYYLPHFKACIQEGGAAGVGATNNGFNDIPVCANHFLLTNILREEWGFKGYVFSDAGSVDDLYTTRQYVKDGASGVTLCVEAGCDLSCSQAYPTYLKEAVEKGLLDEDKIDTACYRLFLTRFRLGMFDSPEKVPYTQIPESVIDCQSHRDLALEVAKESIVLLKNEKSILPLAKSLIKKIVLAGPRVDSPELGRKQTGNSKKNISAYEGICNKVKDTSIEVKYEKEAAKSIEEAQTADVVIYFTSLKEGEVCDRMNLDLASHQEKELKDLIATGTPVVVCLINGGCVTMESWEPEVPAIISAWYPGEEGGTAIASVLFGDYNPSGKLPLTFYKSEKQLLDFEDFNIKKGTTYLYAKEKVMYPFGYGLSYTHFSYDNMKVEKSTDGSNLFKVSFTLKNTGKQGGKEVSQLYIRDKERSTGDQPLKELKRFKKIYLAPAEEQRITFFLEGKDFAFYNNKMNYGVEAGDFDLLVGSSSEDILLSQTVTIEKDLLLEDRISLHHTDTVISKVYTMTDKIVTSAGVNNSGSTVKAPFNVFSSAQVASFEQTGPDNFIIRASGAIGGCPVNAAHYAGVVEDEYATIYLKEKMTDKSYAIVQINQRDLTSNYAKTGIMIKNNITAPGKSAGYLIMCINGYFNGGGLIEWDSDNNGYLDQFKTYNSGKWPKTIAVEKDGKTFNFYATEDNGANWTKVYSQEIESATDMQDVGIFQVSDYKTKPGQAIYSDFKVHEGAFNNSRVNEDKTIEKKREQPL